MVVRQGPPKRRGAFIDAIVGILGVALLVMAGVLGETLPEKEVVAAQYLPEFPLEFGEIPLAFPGQTETQQSLKFYMTEGEEHRIDLPIPHDNVVSISVQIYLKGDDIGSSLPDSFTFTLLRPDGNQEGAPFKVNTAQPKQRDNIAPEPPFDQGDLDNLTKPVYLSGESIAATAWRLGAPPDAEYIGDGETEVPYTLALSMAIDKYTKYTNGTWTLVAKLSSTGDCPQPSTSGQNDRSAECMRETTRQSDNGASRGQDLGNEMTVKFVRYDYYTIQLPDPKAESSDAI